MLTCFFVTDIQVQIGSVALAFAAVLLALFGPHPKEQQHSNTGDQVNGLD